MKFIRSIFRIFQTIIFAGILTSTSVFAQSTEQFTYQSVVRNNTGQLVTNQNISLRFSILQGSVSGMLIYNETKSATTNSNGLATVVIGEKFGIYNINWANGPYFLRVEIDPAGGGSYTISNTSQLLRVPYALYAKTAGKAEIPPLMDVLSKGNNGNGAPIKNIGDPSLAQDAATKAYVDNLKKEIETIQNTLIASGQMVKDIDGNVYGTVTIGTQVWMAQNLQTSKFNNGTSIPLIADKTQWSSLTTPAYCWYNNDEATYKEYGKLYNWYTVNTGNLCPSGWHIPSEAELNTLVNYLGTNTAGCKLKEKGTVHWLSPNTCATNESGFTLLGAGRRNLNGDFNDLGGVGYIWTTKEIDVVSAIEMHAYNNSMTGGVDIIGMKKVYGISVR